MGIIENWIGLDGIGYLKIGIDTSEGHDILTGYQQVRTGVSARPAGPRSLLASSSTS